MVEQPPCHDEACAPISTWLARLTGSSVSMPLAGCEVLLSAADKRHSAPVDGFWRDTLPDASSSPAPLGLGFSPCHGAARQRALVMQLRWDRRLRGALGGRWIATAWTLLRCPAASSIDPAGAPALSRSSWSVRA
mgnify:CR=1 FL=1